MIRNEWLLGLAVTFAAVEARAQEAPSLSNEMRAEYLFQRGEKRFDSGKYAEACADFGESLRLGPKLGTLLNLALCHETVGKLATSWKEWSHAAAWAAQNKQAERHDFAMQHVVALEPRLSRTVFQLPAGTAIATLDVDGEPLPDTQWYLPLYLDPGEHSVALTSPGKQRRSVTFRVVASPTEQIVVVPAMRDEPPPLPASEPPTSPPPDPDATRRLGGYVALAVGSTSLVAGAAFGVSAISARDDIGAHCVGGRCDAAGASSFHDAQDRAAISTAAFALGAVTAVVGAYLVLTSGRAAAAPRAPAVSGVAF